jgi:prevent-host-death family protein
MVMYRVNIHEAKSRLSALLERVSAGERVLICNRNRPVAELGPVAAARTEPRPFGLARGLVTIPSAFFEPLSADELDAFDGGREFVPAAAPAPRVAEGSPWPSGKAAGRTRRDVSRGRSRGR